MCKVIWHGFIIRLSGVWKQALRKIPQRKSAGFANTGKTFFAQLYIHAACFSRAWKRRVPGRFEMRNPSGGFLEKRGIFGKNPVTSG
jgi:hypothetical protein